SVSHDVREAFIDGPNDCARSLRGETDGFTESAYSAADHTEQLGIAEEFQPQKRNALTGLGRLEREVGGRTGGPLSTRARTHVGGGRNFLHELGSGSMTLSRGKPRTMWVEF